MQITNFKDLYIAELQELASMETQIGEVLLLMFRSASHPSLKEALLRHREQTRTQMDRLESMLRNRGSSAYVHTDQAVEALVAEAEKMLKLVK
jgi:ferritin-like metal-binding protein YciE